MKIQVIGSGCPTCKKLYELTQKAVEKAGLEAKVEYLSGQEGIQKIIEMGVMGSPVLAIDGDPVITGFIDDAEKIIALIKTHQKSNL